ncbi:MAG: GNAT family N-acetyltransferase [Thaumarchaeota archaeon]|nr:GNAT family N-acetyltransferase [Nitrososphaerota archaeon]
MDASTNWMPVAFKRLREVIRLGYPAADYWAVYAVENDQVLSGVRVVRIPYTMRNGRTEIVSGIQGVVTRREFSRRGLARTLLAEVHRREAEAGSRLSILVTDFSYIAHNLYLSMGYVDVHSGRLAMKRLDSSGEKNKRPGDFRVVPAKANDAETIERIHSEATKGRVGFTPRPKGYLRALLKLGQVEHNSFRLILSEGKPVAYFHFRKGSGWFNPNEVVMKPGIDPATVLAVLEREASNGWLVLYGTFVNDTMALLKKRNYLFTDHSYSGVLAKPLGDERRRDVRKEMGIDDDSFTCQFLDYF